MHEKRTKTLTRQPLLNRTDAGARHSSCCSLYSPLNVDTTYLPIRKNRRPSSGYTRKEKSSPGITKVSRYLRFATAKDVCLIVVGVLINVITGALLPVCVLFSGRYLDAAKDRDQSKINFWCGLQALAGVASFAAAWIGITCLEWAATNQLARLRATYFHSVLNQDQAFKATFGAGEISHYLEEHASAFRSATGAKTGQIVILASQFIAGYIVAIHTHWKLALILSGMIPVFLAGGAFTLWSVSSLNKRLAVIYSQAVIVLEESFSSMQVISAFTLEQWFTNKFYTAVLECWKAVRRWSAALGLGMGLSMGNLFAFYALGFWAQGKMLAHGYRTGCLPDQEGCLSPGKGITVFFCIAFGAFSLGQAAPPLTAIIRGHHSYKVICNIIDRESWIPVMTELEENKKRIVVEGTIEFANLGYSYYPPEDVSDLMTSDSIGVMNGNQLAVENGSRRRLSRFFRRRRDRDRNRSEILLKGNDNGLFSKERSSSTMLTAMSTPKTGRERPASSAAPPSPWVFRNLNLFIHSGKVVAFVGPSGCGKSTLARLLLRLDNVTEGSILVDGSDLRLFSIRRLRDEISYIGQEAQLFNDTIENNIMHGYLEASKRDIIEAAKLAGAHEFIVKMKDQYLSVVGDNGALLSGGQKQRIAIARALIRRPKILILDEATSALDYKTEQYVQNNIFNLIRENNITTIIIAHRLTTIKDADQIFVFQTTPHTAQLERRSYISEAGTFSELMEQNGYFKRMWESQQYNPNDPPPGQNTPVGEDQGTSSSYAAGLPFLDRMVPKLDIKLASDHGTSPKVHREPVHGREPGPAVAQPPPAPPIVRATRFRGRGSVPDIKPDLKAARMAVKSLRQRYMSVQVAEDVFPLMENEEEAADDQDGCSSSELEWSDIYGMKMQMSTKSESLDESSSTSSVDTAFEVSFGSVRMNSRLTYSSSIEGGDATSLMCSSSDILMDDHNAFQRMPIENVHHGHAATPPTSPRLLDTSYRPSRRQNDDDYSSRRGVSDDSLSIIIGDYDQINQFGDFYNQSQASYRRCWLYLDGAWHYHLLGILGALANGCVFPLFAWCFADFIRVLTLPSAYYIEAGIWTPTWHLLLVALLCFLANTVQHAALNISGHAMVKNLRLNVFYHAIHLPASFYDLPDLEAGYLLSLISTDTLLVKGWASDNVALLLQNLSCLISALIIAAKANYKLALISMAAFFVMVPAVWLQGRFMADKTSPVKPKANRPSLKNASSASVLVETLRCVCTVDAFNLQAFVANKFDQALSNELSRGHRLAVLAGFFIGLSQLCQFGTQALNLWCGGKAFVNGDIDDVGTMLQATFTIIIASMGIGQSMTTATDTYAGKGAAKRIFSFLDLPVYPDPRGEEGIYSDETRFRGDLRFCQVSFWYPSKGSVRKVLNELTFNVPKGSSLALIGESGCGKSTIVSLLERYYELVEPPTSSHSQIYINGIEIRDWNVRSLRECMALVPQEPTLFADTVEMNIRMGNLYASFEDVEAAAKAANAHDFIMNLPGGYQFNIGIKGERLSGGQRQRLAIARALIREGDFLILDEATSALDNFSELSIQETIDMILKSRRKTVIIIAHRLSTIKRADKIVVLKKLHDETSEEPIGSHIVESGTHNELLSLRGEYFRLIRAGLD